MSESAIIVRDNSASARASGQPDPVQAVTWIVCRGAERPVADGRVACPMSGSRAGMEIETCLLCRHLVDTPIDRSLIATCSAGSGPEWPVRWGVL